MRTVAVLSALLTISCGEKTEANAPAWNIERLQLGDTTVVRNSGTDLPLAELTLVQELVIGKVVGGDQEMFGRIGFATATRNGGVLVSEYEPFRIQRFDSAGRLRAVYGGRGEGPGEFTLPSRTSLDAQGNAFHWDFVHTLFAVYDSSGRYRRSLQPRVGTGITFRARGGFAIDSTGILSVRANMVRTSESVTAEEPSGLVRLASDGAILARFPEPAAYGPEARTVRYNPEGGTQDLPIPLSPQFSAAFVTPGIWASGHNAWYRILLHQFPSGLLRIESDHAAVQVSRVERADNAAAATMELQFGDKNAKLPASQIPEQKPFFKGVFGDQSNRMWVELFTRGKRIVETKCPTSQTAFGAVEVGSAAASSCANGGKPRPIARWEEPIVYDIFQPTGEFAGRIALPQNTEFRAAMHNKVWLRVLDSLGVQSIVRYRVVPQPSSPVTQFWK